MLSSLRLDKVSTYLFFSIRKWKIFGIEGEIKDPEKVIEEEVVSRTEARKKGEEQEKNLKENTGNLEETRKTAKYYYDRFMEEQNKNIQLKKRLEVHELTEFGKKINEILKQSPSDINYGNV